jgi:hypothetical protein
MGCQSSTPAPLVLKTRLLKTNHPSLNAIIEEAERSLQELARICNPLEVAIDRFFSVCGRGMDEGFKACVIALVVALIANSKEGDFMLVANAGGFKVRTHSLGEQLVVEYETWRQLATELQYTINDLSDNLLMLMDCASTSHRLNLALVQLIKVEDLRVVDIRKVMVILEKNEETIRSAAELLHLNVRRAKAYSSESELVVQWLRQAEGLRLVSLEAEKAREQHLRSANEVLVQRAARVTELCAPCPSK